VSPGVESITLTSGLFVLAAFFVAAFFIWFLLATLLATELLTTEIAFVAGLLASALIASGRFVRAALFHSFIALSVVCHLCSSPLMID